MSQNAEDWLRSNKRYLIYRYSQKKRLVRIDKDNPRGICEGMSHDWLRRKFFNANNPDEKPKKNFNEYSKKQLDRLTLKQQEIHSAGRGGSLPKYDDALRRWKEERAYEKFKGDPERQSDEVGKVISTFTPSFQAMTTTPLKDLSVDASRLDYTKPATLFAATRDFYVAIRTGIETQSRPVLDPSNGSRRPAAGLLFGIDSKSTGHAMALFIDRKWISFFDPNMGEYATATPDEMASLVATLIVNVYGLDMGTRTMSLTAIDPERSEYF
jgi:hypothetical protein